MKRIAIIIMLTMTIISSVSAQKTYSLGQCRQMALQNNIKIRNAQLNILQAKETEKSAQAKYLPSVSASGVYFHANDYLMKKDLSLSTDQQTQLATIVSQLGLDPTALASLPSSYSFNMMKHGTITQLIAMEPIYAGGQITTGNKLARLQTEVKKLQLQQSQDEILTTTESYYNQLLTLYMKRQTIEAASKQLDRIHQDAENAFKGGLSTKKDMLTVEVKQNELEANRLKLENGIKLCKMVLSQYIGLNNADITIDTTMTDQLPLPLTYAVNHEAALDARTESKLLDKNVEANHLQVKMKRGTMLPTIAVGAAGIYQDLMGSGQTNIIGMATVSIPISELWTNNHAVKHQKIAELIARQDREDNRQLLLIQMQSAYNDLDNAYNQIILARKYMNKTAENLRLNEDYYHAGTSTMSDLLDAQTQDQQSRDTYAEAVCQYLNSRTSYLISTGRSVE